MRLFCAWILLSIFSVNVLAHPVTKPDKIVVVYDSAIAQYIRTDNESAIANFHKFINGGRKTQDSGIQKKVVRSYSYLGSIYTTQGKFTVALKQYHAGLEFADQLNDFNGRAQILLGIGALYYYWHRPEEAMHYYDEAEKIIERTQDKKLLADCYVHKGVILEQKAEFSRALSYYKHAVAIFEELHLANNMTAALTNIGNVYSATGEFKKGIAYLNKALAIATEYQNKDDISCCLINLGIVYDSLHDYATAETYWNRSIAVAKETGSIESQMLGYEAKARIYARKGNFAKAYETVLIFGSLKDSLFNAKNAKQVEEINTKYETEKKERKISEQALTIQRQKAKNQLILSVVLVSVFVLLSGGIYYNYRSKSNQEREKFRIALNAEYQERTRIARDLHDSLGQTLTAAGMHLSAVSNDNVGVDNISKVKKLLNNAIKDVRQISHNLLPEELNFGLVIALQELCAKASVAQTSVLLQVEEDLKLDNTKKQLELSVYRIVQEILNNTMKHASASKIVIYLRRKDDLLLLDIEDNGRGFDMAIINESNGLGWKNIKARINLLNGKINIQSKKNQGTDTKIILPL